MKKWFPLFFAISISLFAISQTPSLKAVTPETEGLSSERLKQIDANINQWIKEEQLNHWDYGDRIKPLIYQALK